MAWTPWSRGDSWTPWSRGDSWSREVVVTRGVVDGLRWSRGRLSDCPTVLLDSSLQVKFKVSTGLGV